MDENLVDELQKFSKDFCEIQDTIIRDLAHLIDTDEIINDVSCTNPSLLEQRIDAALALHHGQVDVNGFLMIASIKAMKLYVQRGEERIPVTVQSKGKVHDLYTAVARAINDKLDKERSEYADLVSKIDKHDKESVRNIFALNPPPKRLNWRQFWRTHCLVSNGTFLNDRNTRLTSIPDLCNSATVGFVRRNRKKQRM